MLSPSASTGWLWCPACPGPLYLPLGSLLGGEGRSWELCGAWHRLQDQGQSWGCCQAVTAQPRGSWGMLNFPLAARECPDTLKHWLGARGALPHILLCRGAARAEVCLSQEQGNPLPNSHENCHACDSGVAIACSAHSSEQSSCIALQQCQSDPHQWCPCQGCCPCRPCSEHCLFITKQPRLGQPQLLPSSCYCPACWAGTTAAAELSVPGLWVCPRRNPAALCVLCSINFNQDASLICVSSDHGTVHIFAAEDPKRNKQSR